MPSQNTGVEMPRTATAMSAWSSAEPGRTAARPPIPMPSTIEMTVAASASRIVAGARSARTSRTGRCSRNERPRSPRIRRPIQRAYWTGSGRSSAYSRRRRSRASGSARCPMAARAGSPRAIAFRRKTSSVIPKRTGKSATSRPATGRPKSESMASGRVVAQRSSQTFLSGARNSGADDCAERSKPFTYGLISARLV